MSWHVTLLFVHTFALVALGGLLRHCPDRLQCVVLWLLIIANLVLLYANASALLGGWMHWMVTRIGYELEHIAVLFWVFRTFINDQERRCLPNSSLSYRSSPR